MSSFASYIPGFLAPSWLLQPKGLALLQGLGAVMDEMVLRAKDGVKARFPLLAPRDGLGAIAYERGLPRGLAESDAAWAQRLVTAYDIWYWAGTPYGILRALYVAGYAPVIYTGQGLSYSLDTATGLTMSIGSVGFSEDFGQGAAFWSVFLVYFPASRWPASWTTAGAPPAQSSDEAQTLMGFVARWKAAFATFRAVVVAGTCPVCGIPPLLCGATGVVCGGTFWSWQPTLPETNLP